MTTLKFERGSAMFGTFCEFAAHLENLVDYVRTGKGPDGHPLIRDTAVAERVGELCARMQSIRSLIYTINAADEQGMDLGAEAAILMLPFSELVQEIMLYNLEVFGPDGLSRLSTEPWLNSFFMTFAMTIAGGSSEIQRNIIGERLLGLPR